MAKGLAVPIRLSSGGGMLVEEGDAHARKIIQLGLGDGDSDNPFQQNENLGLDMIFDLADPISRPRIVVKLKQIFAKWEELKRFKLRENTLRWTKGEVQGEEVLEFKYINLESDEEKDYRRSFLASSGGESTGTV